VAEPYLERLHRVSGDTVNLAVWRGRAVVYLEVLPSPRPLRFVEAPGSRAPLHATALGKAIAAHLPRAEVAAVARASGLPRFTARTVTSLPRLFLELRRVRARGYAVDREEQAAGAVCIAAPVFDRGGIAGALSIAAPAARMDARRLERLIPELAAACGRISHRLGHRATGEEARRLAAGSAAAGGVGRGT
jgi:IclR family acetate operon transcriptional repressor